MADADRAGQGASEFRAFLRALPDDIALANERNPGNPIVFRPVVEPDPATVRLMAALGVPVEVRPVRAAASTDVRRGTEAQDYRASLARAARRADAGQDVGLCVGCATEADVEAPAHDPGCRLKPAPEAPQPEAVKGGQWEKGRDGVRRSTKTHSIRNGQENGFTAGEMQRRHEAFLDTVPTAATCAMPGCEDWRFDGTAADARDAARAHRETEHPTTRKGGQRGAKPQTPMQQTPRTREAAAAAPVEPVGETAVTATSRVVAANEAKRKTAWTREAIVAAIQAHAAEHGQPPTSTDWRNADPAGRRPTGAQVVYVFGGWAAAIEAAGFPRPARGRRPALPRREPQGRETPALSGASPAETPAALTAARTVLNDSPGPGCAEPGSRPENADRRLAFAALLRALADTVEHHTFRDASLVLIFDGLALEARKGLDA